MDSRHADAPGGWGFYPRVFAVVATALLGLLVLMVLKPFAGAIVWAVVLAFLLFPLDRWLRGRLGEDRAGVVAGVLTLACAVLVVAPAILFGVVFARQARELVGVLQQVAERYHLAQVSDLWRVPLVDEAVQWVGTLLAVSADQVQAWIVTGGRRALGALVSISGSLFASTLGILADLTFTLFFLFFLLRDGEAMTLALLRLVPLDPARKADVAAHLGAVTRAVVLGSLVTAVVQGTLVGIAFAIVGLPSPLVFGALAMVASLVPVVGTSLVWVPGAVALGIQGRWGAVIFLALWGAIVVALADNVVRPWFISGRAQMGTLPVLVGLMGGLAAFGPVGIVLGPVVVALVVTLLRFAQEAYETGPR